MRKKQNKRIFCPLKEKKLSKHIDIKMKNNRNKQKFVAKNFILLVAETDNESFSNSKVFFVFFPFRQPLLSTKKPKIPPAQLKKKESKAHADLLEKWEGSKQKSEFLSFSDFF